MSESGTSRARLIDVASTVLLSIAVVMSAWAGYEAARWSGEQAIAFSEANASRVESTRTSTRAGQLRQVDIATFIAWTQAYSAGEQELEEFLFERFRPPMKAAVQEWIATRPLENADAPATPFALASYRLPEEDEADRLSAVSEEKGALARRNNQRSDNYVLCVVLFASVLFFAGIATKLSSERMQLGLLGLGTVVLIGTGIWMATFPISFGV